MNLSRGQIFDAVMLEVGDNINRPSQFVIRVYLVNFCVRVALRFIKHLLYHCMSLEPLAKASNS